MQYSIASYSFHRLLAAGKQDIFQYITDCKVLGCSALDAWNGHLAPLVQESDALKAGADAAQPLFSQAGLDYLARVKAAADEAGLPFGCLAIDGAHFWEPTAEARQINRWAAYRWLDAAARLGARQIRIDTGGTADFPQEQFDVSVEGYSDMIARAGEKGIGVVIENHWGASNIAENVIKLLEAVPGLKLLFDTNNWAEGTRERAWELTAKYASATHIKTFEFDANGDDPTVDLHKAIRLLVEAGYTGEWGIESVPRDGDEYGAAKKTIALIERALKN